MADSDRVPLTPGSVINVPLGSKLEMQLKLPGSEGVVTLPEDSSRTVQQKMEKTVSQQSKRVAQIGDSTVTETSQAVQKMMHDSKQMVSQSSIDSETESSRVTKTVQQKMQYSKQTYSSSSTFESS
ncbi:uncharacterized protein LOC135369072 [Ornithodoros turicata]|uniref:uncharacterized protein LOC135369072 n=1 Tax=Ornithodoros turicata TaxID=34597 RepID=UPI0031393C20